MKKIVYLLLLGLASCQQDDIITEVPKDRLVGYRKYSPGK